MALFNLFKKKQEPRHAGTQEGLKLLQRGAVDEALELLERVRAGDESGIGGGYAYGLALVEALRFEEALAIAGELERQAPEDPAGPLLAARALKELSRHDEALEQVETALSRKSTSLEAWVVQAQILNALERPKEAQETLDTVLKLDKRHAPALREAAYAALYQRDLKTARWHCSGAVKFAPDDPRTMVLNSVVSMIEGNLDAALDDLEEALEANPYLVEAFNHKGYLLRAMGREEEAEEALLHARSLNPHRSSVHYYLGLLYAQLNRMDEAREAFDATVALRPAHGLAHLNRAKITKYAAEDPHIRAMQEALEHRHADAGLNAIYLHFALAKACEDAGDFDQAFEHLAAGNDLKRRSLSYSVAEDLEMLRGVRENYTPEVFVGSEGLGLDSELPVFVIGMPRTGSTLVEQILDCHPSMVAAGETDLFGRMVSLSGRSRGHGENLSAYLQEMAAEASPRYLDALETVVPSTAKAAEAERITDKTLNNYLYLGLIHLGFPNARVIHCRRSPLDTCLSCFKNVFDFGQEYTYDPRTLGEYYREYDALMLHWESVLPGRCLHLDYERLVENPEGVIRELLEWIGLEFDPACLEFYKSKRMVQTASLSQVRQPIYKGSVGLWRRYERHLSPLVEVLGPLAEKS
jgi:tetratricopeptide (TPR) repeat protein